MSADTFRHYPVNWTLVDTVDRSADALAAHCGARRLQSSPLIRWLERIFGTALVLFGVGLPTSRR